MNEKWERPFMTIRILDFGPAFAAGGNEMHMDLNSKEPQNQISAFAVKCNLEIASIYFNPFESNHCQM